MLQKSFDPNVMSEGKSEADTQTTLNSKLTNIPAILSLSTRTSSIILMMSGMADDTACGHNSASTC